MGVHQDLLDLLHSRVLSPSLAVVGSIVDYLKNADAALSTRALASVMTPTRAARLDETLSSRVDGAVWTPALAVLVAQKLAYIPGPVTPPRVPKVAIYSSSGTWVRPASVSAIYLSGVGTGGGGAGGGFSADGGGGGAGMSVYRYPVSVESITPGQSVTVTVPAGGAGGAGGLAGGNGQAVTFGSLLSLAGGAGGGTGAFIYTGGLSGGGIGTDYLGLEDGTFALVAGYALGSGFGDSGGGGGSPGSGGGASGEGGSSRYAGGFLNAGGGVGGGGGGSAFGPGGVPVDHGNGGAGGTGAGGAGGSRNNPTRSGGSGGSGLLIVEWWE